MIQLDVLDPCLTECELRFPCLSQLMSVVRRLPTMGRLGRKFLHKLPHIEILRNLESPFILWIQTDIHFLASTTYSDFARSRSTNFWIFPVDVFGSGPNTTVRGVL